MKQWEIKVTRASMEHIARLIEELEMLGNEGWEPFHIHEMTNLREREYVIFSKRQRA